nr:DUF2939 domain-containing protein [Methylobacterium sp. OTU13CASTA1]
MRWWSIPVVLALCWFVFTLTPFWALYDLARAVQAHDVAYIERHVNFRTLRLSVIRQAAAAAQARGETGGAEPRERQRVTDALVALAIPIAESLVTPQTVVDLLDDGWPQSIDLGPPEPRQGDTPGDLRKPGLHAEGFRRLVPFYLSSEMRGFRTVVIPVPPDETRDRRFRLRLRLRGWTWRLVDIELPEELRERIAQKLARTGRSR